MSNIEILLIILGLTIGISGALFMLFPYLKKIGINTEDLIKKAETALKGVDGAIQIAEQILPSNKVVNILDEIDKFAKIGVDAAEQLYISSQIPADNRKDKAKEITDAALKSIGINVTDELSTVISGVIESTIYVSKTPDEIKVQSQSIVQNTTTALQKQIAELQTSNVELNQKNIDLINKINAIQNTVAPIVSSGSAQ